MSEFEEVFEENYRFYIIDSCEYRYVQSKEFGKAMYEAGQQSQQARIDELQARIDKTIDHIKDWYGCVELSHIVDILEGNKDET